MKLMKSNYRLPGWTFWLICILAVWFVEKLSYSSLVKFLMLMAFATAGHFLERYRIVLDDSGKDSEQIPKL
jgi:hypothetical protein